MMKINRSEVNSCLQALPVALDLLKVKPREKISKFGQLNKMSEIWGLA